MGKPWREAGPFSGVHTVWMNADFKQKLVALQLIFNQWDYAKMWLVSGIPD